MFTVCLALASGCASNDRNLAPVETLPAGDRQEAASNKRESPPQPATAAQPAYPSGPTNYRMAMAAKKMVGVPYRWGGTTPSGFDCSGLVYYAYRKVGLNVPRTTWAQYQGVKRVHPAGLRVGDLLFFRLSGRRVSHVGIYLGRNQFVHAPSTGSRVSYAHLTMPFWRQRFVGAGRLY
jgi:cell wall-associated NlpC family hydrolase